jgi:hypothetical protein
MLTLFFLSGSRENPEEIRTQVQRREKKEERQKERVRREKRKDREEK